MENIYIIPTDKPSRLTKINSTLFFGKNEREMLSEPSLDIVAQNIYITSDEEIKEGKFAIVELENTKNLVKLLEIDKVNNIYLVELLNINNTKISVFKSEIKKIILTTDQDLIKDGVQSIDDKFLEWFVKNPSCEQVEVEIDLHDSQLGNGYCFDKNIYKIITKQERITGADGSRSVTKLIPEELEVSVPLPQNVDFFKQIMPEIKNLTMKKPMITGTPDGKKVLIQEETKEVTAESIVQKTANLLGKSIPETFEIMDNFSKDLDKLKEKHKQERLAEAAARYACGWGEDNDEKSFVAGAKWLHEDLLSLDETNLVKTDNDKLLFQVGILRGMLKQIECMYSEETVKKCLSNLLLTNPLHLKMVSDGNGEFPDGYKLNEEGINYIVEQLKIK
jgi:hypothetical protein